MEIREFIESLRTSDFSLVVENDKLVLKALGKNDINEIRKNEFVINYIKDNKNEIIRYLSDHATEGNGEVRESSKNITAIYPLSSLQQGMLFHGLYNERSGVYIEQFSCDIISLELQAFQESWKQVLKNHTILRSAFYYDDFSIPVQAVYREVKLPLEVFDYRNLTSEQQANAQREYEDHDRDQGFDFKAAPLVRIAIFRLSDDRYRMLWTWHHILFDGWSTPILMEELLTTYQSIVAGKDIVKREEDRYEEFIRYLERIDKGAEEQYWREYLKGVDQSVLLPFISNTKQRNKGVGQYKSVSLHLDAEATRKLEVYSQKSRVTVNTVMQAIWAYLLSKYTGNRNVVYGVIVSGRPDDLSSMDSRVGLFINTLPLNTSVQDGRQFATWLEDIQAQQAASRHYQHTPLQNIQRWAGVQGDLFDSLLVFENYPITKLLSSRQFNLQIEDVRMREQTNYPLNVIISAGNELNIKFLFNSSLLDEAYVEFIRGHFQHVLSQILHNSINTLADIRLLTESEEARILFDFNDTKVEYPANICVPDLFEAQVEKSPDEAAVVFGGVALNYRTLNELSNQLAHYLKSRGVRPDVLVPICVERSVEMVIGVVAILKAGGAYVPIDPEYPAERISYMLQDIGSTIILCTKSTKAVLGENATLELIEIDLDLNAIGSQPTTNPKVERDPNALGYVLFTSGSTGRPKGVELSSASLVNLLFWQEKQFENKHRRVLQFANLNFDVSFLEIFSTLCYGSTVYLLAGDRRKDLSLVLEDICKQKITHLFIPFIALKSLSELILQQQTTSLFLEEIITAGEQLKLTDEIQTLLEERKIKLINQYGPTEAHVVSSYVVNSQSATLPPIGKPVDNTTLYVLNENLALVPIGVIGELYIGGVQVARGYLNRPDLTAEKFISDPFFNGQGGTMYRTGDLARWLPDGNLEYFGRVDDQVKIRGYRVELGEIESVLQQHESVSQAAVIAVDDGAGNKRLVAYVVPGVAFSRENMMAYLKRQLPDYMIPALWIELEALPTSANGKIDRKALPRPETAEGFTKQYVAPRTVLEEKLTTIWQKLLGIEKVGIEDDFFELGGHSLLAIRVLSSIRKELGLEVAIKDLFVYTTIASLAEFLASKSKITSSPEHITTQPRPEFIPLSFSQERLWFIDRLEGSVPYHIPVVLKLKGKLNVQALSQAFRDLLQRHEVLRTVIRQNHEQAYQFIQGVDGWNLSVVEDSTYQKDSNALTKYIQHLTREAFDLANDYMLRAVLIRMSASDNILVLTIHHIATDGWSMPIIVQEVAELYLANLEDRESKLEPLTIQFADYAIWQRQHLSEELLLKKLKFWKQKLDGVSPLQLPTDRKRPAMQSSEGDLVSFTIEKELASALQKLSIGQGTTLYMTLLAAFNVLLYRYSGQQDICVGTPIANRTRQEFEGLVGFFVNSIAFRNNITPEQSFLTLLQQVKKTTLEAYEHQDMPFEKVVEAVVKERDLSRSPVFQVMFALQNTPEIPELEVGDLSLSPVDLEHTVSKFDLSFFLTETSNGLEGSVEYATALYNKDTISRMTGHFKQLLSSIGKMPYQTVERLRMLTAAEEFCLTRTFNATVVPYPSEKTLIDLFGQSVTEHPNSIAIISDHETITYKELDDLSNQLAHYLQTKGVKAEALVPICIHRSIKMVVGILGILKAGAAYVPIDPEYPEERINYIVSDANASLVISNREVQSRFKSLPGVEVIDLDEEWSAITNQPANRLQTIIHQNQLAYIIYTSGSTGKPKGVMIEHGNVYSFLSWCQQEFLSSPFKIGYASTSISFDLSVFEIFYPLSVGKSIRLLRDGLQIGKYLHEDDFVMVNTVPSVVENLIQLGVDLSRVAVLNMAGEPIPLHVQQHLDVEKIEVRNLYGPSEDTTYSTVFRLKKGEPALIGKPISNTQIYILHDSNSLQPIGIPGEICIGGAGVARGYLNRTDLTKTKFIPNPFDDSSGSRLYRTGDLGRWLSDGNIEYLGRLDNQVKIRGYRIELGEIEAVLQESELVQQAVVVVREDGDRNKMLVAYIVPKGMFDRDSVVAFLKNKIPEYMIPGMWVELKQLPLTPNGKVDRKRLPDPNITSIQTAEYVAPRNRIEKILAVIWEQLLNVPRIGIRDNFFSLGAHSLLAMRVVTHIRRELGTELPIKQIFLSPTVAELAAYLEQQPTASILPAIIVQRRPALIPLSFSQERLWFIDKLEGTAPYHLPAVLRLKGDVNIGALQYSLQTIANRHEVLRTVYLEKDGQPYQFIKEKDGLVLTHVNATMHQHDPGALHRMIDDLIRKPFDLSGDDMLRATIISVDDKEHILVVTMHHIASDAWSMSIIVKEVIELYDSFIEGRTPNLPEPELQYADYALWQRNYLNGEALEHKLSYWKEKLKGVSTLDLPTDYNRPLASEGSSGMIRFRIEKEVYEQVQNLSLQMGSSSFMTLLSAFSILLHRYTGQEDISVGTSIASREQKEIEHLVGFFVNTLALRSQVNDDQSFTDLLAQVKTTTLEAYAYQDVPFEKVVNAVVEDRDMSRSPLFQVMLVSQNTPEIPQLKFGDVSLSYEAYQQNISKFDITYFVNEVDGELQVRVEYRSDLFREDSMMRMAEHFRQLLSSIVRAPEQKIGLLSMLRDSEKQHLLSQNNIVVSYPEEKTIVALFEEQVEKSGTHIALVFEEQALTYQELNFRANQVAHYLRSRGVQEDSLVPLCIERSASMIIGLLGILKAGAAYVPIEPDFPEERKMFVIEDSRSTIVVSSTDSSSSLPYLDNVQVLEIDDHFSGIRSQPTTNPTTELRSQNLAYVIYTSGSTGRPKGVMIEHGNLVDYVFGLQEAIGIDECKSFASVSSIATDLGNTVIFPSLVFGGTLHLFSKESVTNAENLQEYFRLHGVECLKIVPSHWKALSVGDRHLLPTKLLIFGGEALSFEVVDRLRSSGAQCRIVNHYGPTETTIGKLLHEVKVDRKYKSTIPIGKPFSNTEIYVLSGQLQLCPIGVAGELFIGGKGVARGYLHNSELTEQKFVQNPFNDSPAALLYRTGDLVRYLEDGSVEFIGRVDDQVKIRGYRVELGEIVNAILQTGHVHQALVLAKESVDGNKRLVCYLIPASGYDKEDLLTVLKETLPEYMIPANWVELQTFPMLPNGKIDRKALPDPDSSEELNSIYEEPRNETERKMVRIWEDVLEVERIGINDDFFSLGGHSLLAVRLISLVRKELEVEIPISDLFDYPTIKSLTGQIEGRSGSVILPGIKKIEPRPARIPLSFSQERLWFIDRLEGSVQYHVPTVLRLKGSLNIKALNYALQQIVRRHEVLRSVIREEEGRPYQQVIDSDSWELNVVGGYEYSQQPERFQQYVHQLIHAPFDLANDYMIRGTLITFTDEEHVLVITLHHVASDGWSKSVLVKEVEELYSSFIEARGAVLPLLAVQYADYAIWQRSYLEGKVLDKKLNYWKNKLNELSPLQLPTDYPRPAVQSTRGAETSFVIEPALSESLHQFGQKQGTTLFMTLLAAFKVLMHRYSGQEDICVGTPIAGRLQQDLENLIGFFVNTLALRTEVRSSDSFAELLQKIKGTTLEAYENQEVPFEKVVDTVMQTRDLGKNPLFQVMFVLRNTPEIPELKLGDVQLLREGHEHTTSLFDLTVFITESPQGLYVSIEYCIDLFKPSTISRMIAHFKELLHAVLKTPETSIGLLTMLTAADRQQLLVDFNNTQVIYPPGMTIIDLFEDQVTRTPESVAVVFEDQYITYKQLNKRSNQFARYLVKKGVGRETLVAVCMERSHEMIIAILGVLKAGAAYVPIDPEYPAERISYMLQDTGTTWVICSNKTKSAIPTHESVEPIVVDADWPLISLEDPADLKSAIDGNQLAYVIYTSGSTGRAKGVMIEHRNVYEFIRWCQGEFADSSFETVYAGTSICFDLSIFEIFFPITVGKRLRVIENGLYIGQYLSQDKQVMTNSVPTIIQTLINEGIDTTNITVMNMAGEPIPLQVQHSLDPQKMEIRNLYGPTEDTTYSTVFRLEKNKPVLIGKPISNTRIYVVSKDMQLVPVGVSGEICIAGAGVARGYLNRPDLTKEKFVNNPFSNDSEVLYKTGDLGRWLSDGNLEYLGRVDHQVKIRGYRIELGEIETVLAQCEMVDDAIVVTRRANDTIKKLVGYVVPNWKSIKAKEKELYTQQVSNWKDLYETEYEKTETDDRVDPEFNIIGWNDSFAGVPIPAVQMKEWLNDIVNIILSKDAGNVLEIGCGTGLIFYQLAGRVEKYIGTDFSRSSVNQVRTRISQQARDYGPTELQVCAAHEISVNDTQRIDTVILNSVVQYFPGEDYLTDVIGKSISILKGKGRIIIGDVRDNRLLELFKSRLMLQKFQDTVRVKEFNWAVSQEMLKEEELCFSPDYFFHLKALYPEISHVDIQLKKGTYVNELTLYRYNVIVYVGTDSEWNIPEWQNWTDLKNRDSIIDQLHTGVTTIALRDVPNFRLWKERLLTEALDERNAGNVGELKQATFEMDTDTKQVMHILTTAEENGYSYQLLPDEDALKMNILIELNPSGRFVKQPYSEKDEKNKAAWTNVPLFSEISLILQKDIRTSLQQRLPDYMIPQELIALAKMPLTSNGKVDRTFLSQREDRALSTQLNYEPPVSDVEQKLAVIWQDLLGIERVGIHDDFFELGGHSLLAMRVISAIRKQMGVELAIKELFHLTTVGALAKYIEIQTKTFSDEETSSEFELINI